MVDIPATVKQKLQESDISCEGKEKLKQIFANTGAAWFKNDWRFDWTHAIERGVHLPVQQYALNLDTVQEKGLTVKKLSTLWIIHAGPNTITKSPIQAVKNPSETHCLLGDCLMKNNFRMQGRQITDKIAMF